MTAVAAVICVLLNTAAQAKTIVVNSLADPGASGICALRDAITAANTTKAVNGCVAGSGHDEIHFLVNGKIRIVSTLPPVTHSLTIKGPEIKIDGGNAVQVIRVYSGATLTLRNLMIVNGSSNFTVGDGDGGGIHNDGKLIVVDCTLSQNFGANFGGDIANEADANIIDSVFSGNQGFLGGGGIFNS
jgi:CSLREA domain-containing protein